MDYDEVCGCGQPARYDTTTGAACNKYGRCSPLARRLDALAAENARLREALEEIARQKLTDELETEADVEYADFEEGYDCCIRRARAALKEQS